MKSKNYPAGTEYRVLTSNEGTEKKSQIFGFLKDAKDFQASVTSPLATIDIAYRRPDMKNFKIDWSLQVRNWEGNEHGEV